MIVSTALFSVVFFCWYVLLTRRLSVVDSLILSLGLSVLIPPMIISLSYLFSYPIDTITIISGFVLSAAIPLILLENARHQRDEVKSKIRGRRLQYLANHNTLSISLRAKVLIAILLVASAAVIIVVKWSIPVGMNSFAEVGLDVIRISYISQVIASEHMIPYLDYPLYTDAFSPTGAMPVLQVFDSIFLEIDSSSIVDILNYKSLMFSLIGSLAVFSITKSLTNNYIIGGLAALFFAASITNFNPIPSIIVAYAIFPLLFFTAIRYVQTNSGILAIVFFILVGGVFLTHHGGALLTVLVFLIALLLTFLKPFPISIGNRIANTFIMVIDWLVIAPAFYIFVFKVDFYYFLEFFIAYWKFPYVQQARVVNETGTDLAVALLYIAFASAMFTLYFCRNRIKLYETIPELLKTNWTRTILPALRMTFRYIPIILLAVVVSYSLIEGKLVGKPFGNFIIKEFSRPYNMPFLGITALAFMFITSKRNRERDGLYLVYAYFAPLIMAMVLLLYPYFFNKDQETFERTVGFTHPIVAVMAALTVYPYLVDKGTYKKYASMALIAFLIISPAILSFKGIEKYYKKATFPQFISAMEELKTKYNGETILYDFHYVNAFLHPNPDLYFEPSHLPAQWDLVRFIKNSTAVYIITRGNEAYWQEVLNLWLTNPYDTTNQGVTYEELPYEYDIVIYKIVRPGSKS